MRLKSVGLPRSQRFIGSPAALRRLFGDLEMVSAYRGWLNKRFVLDSAAPRTIRFKGPVVASLSFSRARTAMLQLYPLAASSCSAELIDEFERVVLPRMRCWLDRQLAKPETAVLGHEQLIVEWSSGKFHDHEIRFR